MSRISACLRVNTVTGEEFLSHGLVEAVSSVFGMSTLMNVPEIGVHVFYQGR